MRTKRFLIGLSIGLLSVACGGDRYAIVSGGGEDGGAYRLDKRTGEVIRVTRVTSWRVLSPAPEEFARADLRDVYIVSIEEEGDDILSLKLYNGTAIEFSEVTFSVHTHDKVRLYRTHANLKPLAVGYVQVTIITDGTPPRQVVIVSAKGIRRGDVPSRSGP